jgi:hypothetical protein
VPSWERQEERLGRGTPRSFRQQTPSLEQSRPLDDLDIGRHPCNQSIDRATHELEASDQGLWRGEMTISFTYSEVILTRFVAESPAATMSCWINTMSW